MEKYNYHCNRDDAWFEEESRKFHAKGADALSNEGVLNLAETIIKEIKEEVKHVVRAHYMSPDDDAVKASVTNMRDLLNSEYFYILTMGHGNSLRDYFERKCGITDGRSRENAAV